MPESCQLRGQVLRARWDGTRREKRCGVTNQDDTSEEQNRYTSNMNRDIHLDPSVGGRAEIAAYTYWIVMVSSILLGCQLGPFSRGVGVTE